MFLPCHNVIGYNTDLKLFRRIDQFTAPFGQIIELRQILHESGVRLLRVIVREEGKYYTIDLDPATAHQWGKDMMSWAESYAKGAP